MAPLSTKYSSTRYHDTSKQEFFSFEDVVLKGLAEDGGLFHPDSIPSVATKLTSWQDLAFPDLAFNIMRLYIDESEISNSELKSIIDKTYSTFRHPDVTPVVSLDKSKDLHLLELFHGPTFAFKDVALQFLGNLFEFFLVRKNKSLAPGQKPHHLTVIGATSGDTGSAAIYGLRGKKDVSIFIMFPDGKVSPVQEAQMTTVLDPNVHNLAVEGTFDDCQDTVKALFADPEMNKTHHLAAVNSINWARILAQITYYFYAYFSLLRQDAQIGPNPVKFVVPSGNFGDILAGFFAKRMGLPIEKLVIATNENDILHRFWQTGTYSKHPVPASEAEGGLPQDGVKAHSDGVKETLSPAMDILVSSNFERLLWYLQYDHEVSNDQSADPAALVHRAGSQVNTWFQELKTTGSFSVHPDVLANARRDFTTHRVSDTQTLETIRSTYKGEIIEKKNYVLDPHTAIGVAAAIREVSSTTTTTSSSPVRTISLSTAHPAKFSGAVELALKDEKEFSFNDSVLPEEFKGLDTAERRVLKVCKEDVRGLKGIRDIIVKEVEKEKTL
ncbi:putative threonine synthase [Phaeomoniella chlamydospora]|uniref:threonine synthase n=1 Tax=Phaeomoniella chlamydospora TaxID=158046 RepID=A0A0G2EAC4_PHACM|nr:putative threonine synthase [Phaeomoniella chlamydospora]